MRVLQMPWTARKIIEQIKPEMMKLKLLYLGTLWEDSYTVKIWRQQKKKTKYGMDWLKFAGLLMIGHFEGHSYKKAT